MPRKGDHKPTPPLGDPNDPHGMGVLAEQFLEWMRVHNFAAGTVETRRTHLGYFIKWCAERGILRPTEVTKAVIERYQRFLHHYRKRNGDPLSVRSQVTRLVPIRAWFKWLVRQNHVPYNPASDIELPKLGQQLPKCILTQSEAEQVLNLPNASRLSGIRDRAILETLYSTGIRRFELVGLRVYDLDAGRGTVTVRQGKGNKDRVIPIGERAMLWVDRYLREVRPTLLVSEVGVDVLFLTRLGEAFTLGYLSTLVNRYVKAADLSKQGSCHLMRHTMATLMLENGADIRFIQAMLGHAKLDTTQIYTQVSISKLKEIHTATHPARPARSP